MKCTTIEETFRCKCNLDCSNIFEQDWPMNFDDPWWSDRSTYKDSAIFIDGVEDRDRASLSVDRINLWRLPKSGWFEPHVWQL